MECGHRSVDLRESTARRYSPKQLQISALVTFYRAMLYISAVLCRHAVSVRPSVTFVSCAKTNKDIFEIYSPSGSQAILVFHTKRGGAIPTGTPLTGASMQGGVKK